MTQPLSWLVDDLNKTWTGGWLVAYDAMTASVRIGTKVHVYGIYGELPEDDMKIHALGVVEQIERRTTFAQVSCELLTGDLSHDWYAAGCPPKTDSYTAVKVRRLASS
jgi:hypothetical protein